MIEVAGRAITGARLKFRETGRGADLVGVFGQKAGKYKDLDSHF